MVKFHLTLKTLDRLLTGQQDKQRRLSMSLRLEPIQQRSPAQMDVLQRHRQKFTKMIAWVLMNML
ncbi:hypothetical protein OAB13_08450 [Salibacteraceae bacterium]|nr:hypothetical protein [Salibacteraceae bacterium]